MSRNWTRADTIAVTLITTVAGALRLVTLRTPPGFVFDEFYAADACLFVRGVGHGCRTATEIGVVHPPLAKWLIGIGIRAFGFTSGGWRIVPVLAGTAGVAVVYLLARRVLASTLGAVVASSLVAVDLLHFVLSRTAMLDVFVVLFGTSAFLFVLYDGARPAGADGAWARRWLVLAGLAGGAATACKWSGGYLLAGVIVVAFFAAHDRRERDVVPIVACLVVLPVLVYTASFVGRVHGSLLAWPWSDSSWWHALVHRQRVMADGHLGDLPNHPYMSPAWSWPLVKRPVLFWFDGSRPGTYREILAMGNPVLWTAGVIAAVAAGWEVVRRRRADAAELVVVVGLATAYLPWVVLVRDDSFLSYFLPALPFVYLALARVVARVRVPRQRAVVAVALGAFALVGFVFYFPLLTDRPMEYRQWDRRMLVFDCAGDGTAARHRPTTEPSAPPRGWCWV